MLVDVVSILISVGKRDFLRFDTSVLNELPIDDRSSNYRNNGASNTDIDTSPFVQKGGGLSSESFKLGVIKTKEGDAVIVIPNISFE